MKSNKYYHLTSFIILIFAGYFHALACGPFPPIIPTPKFFTSNWDGLLSHHFHKQENLRLWQTLTSNRIPLEDIEQAVYKDTREKYDDMLSLYQPAHTNNLFYRYIQNTKDREISEFLITAKTLEEQRAAMSSPWYYPSSRNYNTTEDNFFEIIERCKCYKGTRLKDRYALQAVRALYASRKYDECIEYFRKAFKDFPDTNLFKQMAMDYVAGCWSNLGETEKANEYFAKSDDLSSIACKDPVAYMAEHNPDSPTLMSQIQSYANDSASFCAIKPIAEKTLRTNQLKNRGDWEFTLAYMYGEYYKDFKKASQYINRALQHRFSSDDFREHARAYRMKIDAKNGHTSSLLADMKWMESKMDMLSPTVKEWNRMVQNIVYTAWIPKLWEKGDYTTAILLCGYADNLIYSQQYPLLLYLSETEGSEYLSYKLENLRKSHQLWNEHDYTSLSFQLMGSLTSAQLIEVKRNMSMPNSLYAYLKKHARHDADFINELIGTLALREENYQRAVQYLSQVSDEYLQTMNLYKSNYLKKDPFAPYTTCGHYKDESGKWSTRKNSHKNLEYEFSKYKFAQKMLKLQNEMKHGRSADERGLARLKYAIGRYNSFESCWALTQYWRGTNIGLFEPMLDYWSYNDEIAKQYHGFLYNYSQNNDCEKTKAIYLAEIQKALSMLQSDEYKAEARYMLGEIKTVLKHYSHTTVAQHIKTSCDHWEKWL